MHALGIYETENPRKSQRATRGKFGINITVRIHMHMRKGVSCAHVRIRMPNVLSLRKGKPTNQTSKSRRQTRGRGESMG